MSLIYRYMPENVRLHTSDANYSPAIHSGPTEMAEVPSDDTPRQDAAGTEEVSTCIARKTKLVVTLLRKYHANSHLAACIYQ